MFLASEAPGKIVNQGVGESTKVGRPLHDARNAYLESRRNRTNAVTSHTRETKRSRKSAEHAFGI